MGLPIILLIGCCWVEFEVFSIFFFFWFAAFWGEPEFVFVVFTDGGFRNFVCNAMLNKSFDMLDLGTEVFDYLFTNGKVLWIRASFLCSVAIFGFSLLFVSIKIRKSSLPHWTSWTPHWTSVSIAGKQIDKSFTDKSCSWVHHLGCIYITEKWIVNVTSVYVVVIWIGIFVL